MFEDGGASSTVIFASCEDLCSQPLRHMLVPSQRQSFHSIWLESEIVLLVVKTLY
jgi:hypothetical protein